MKYYHLLLLIPFLIACSNKNPAMEHLEKNAQHFKDLSNTEYLMTQNEIAYFTLTDTMVHIQLINRDPSSDNNITNCTINKKSYDVVKDTQSSWNNNYIISLNKKIKSAKIICTLTDGTKISQKITQF